LYPALVFACTACPGKEQTVLVEEKVPGMEFSCITITDHQTGELMPLPPTEIVSETGREFFDYEQKYMPGRASKFTPARVSQDIIAKMHAACVATTKILGFTNISRVDGFVTPDGRVVIIDPNSLSGMAPSSFLFREAAEVNMSHTHIINHLIETELAHHSLSTMKNNHMAHGSSTIPTAPKLRVAVLLGGRSNEKEISLESGRNVVYKLSPEKYEALPIFVNKDLELFPMTHSMLVRNSTKEIEELVTKESIIPWNSLPDIADFVFLGLHGGEGEDGSIQGALEMLGLPYNGSSVLTSALCMDKFKTGQLLKHLGFEVPAQLLINKETWLATPDIIIKQVEEQLSYPCIMKPHDDGCSMMVKKIRSADDLHDGFAEIFANNKTYALLEELVTGMELTVGVLGNRTVQAFPPSQAIAAGGILSILEKFLPGAGENRTPAPLSAEATLFVQRTVEMIYKALDARGYSRIDCFYQTAEESRTGKERLVFLELNSLPGLTPATCLFHQAAEINIRPMELIDRIIELGLEEHGMHVNLHKDMPASTIKNHEQHTQL
jgi:D-alanine-D-alanine ligase